MDPLPLVEAEAVGWATTDWWGKVDTWTGCFQLPKGIGAGLGLSEDEAKMDGQVMPNGEEG